ncbi:MAG: hypothetical protein R6U11_11115 [Bacteroidales bacterium]
MKKVMTPFALMLSLFLLFNLNSFEVNAAAKFASAKNVSDDSTDLEGMVRANMMGNYFSRINLNQLKEDDKGVAIKNGIEDAKDQMTTIQFLLTDLSKNNNVQVREYVYDQLLKAELKKVSGFLGKAALNSVFDNHSEPNANLKKKVQDIKKKMQ